MSTLTTTMHTALPPPTRHFLHRERPVGWLRGHTLGFFGFADTREAANAAWVAYRTVSRKVAPLLGIRPAPIDIEPLGIEWRNGREVIVASGRPVAQLVRPEPDSPSGANWFGFSIELSPVVSERVIPEVMRAAGHALLKSGIDWSMVRSRSRLRRWAMRRVDQSSPSVANHRRMQRHDRRVSDTRAGAREMDPFGHERRRSRRVARRRGSAVRDASRTQERR